MIELDTLLLIGAVVLIVAIIAARIGSRVGLPALLVFLALGMVMGDSGLGVRFSDAGLANDLGFAALVLILAEGGLTTRWRDIRNSVGPAVLLATVGIGVSIALMAFFGYFVLGLDLWLAILLGAVTAPTDSAAVFSVLRNVPDPAPAARNPRGGVRPERRADRAHRRGGQRGGPHRGPREGGGSSLGGIIVLELVAGLLIGMALGWVGVQILRRVALPSSGLYPLATLGWAVFAYGLADLAHTSGFAAVYVCAVILGNANLPHRGRDPLVRRGGRLDRPDRAVRDARTAVDAEPAQLERSDRRSGRRPVPHLRRPAGVGAGVGRAVPDAGPPAAVLVLGGTAGGGADRARHRPALGGRAERRLPLRRRLGLRDRLHLPAGADAALRGAAARADQRRDRQRGGGRGRSAGQDLRRSAAGADPGGVAA